MSLVIGVDIGTQGTKAALFGADGRCLARASERSRLHRPGPGVVEEDPERQFASVCRTVRKCLNECGESGADVAGIGIDGQMAGVLGVGDDGLAVTPYDSWLDTRCGPHIEVMSRRAGDRITAKTGGPPSFNHGPKILWWKHERPKDYAGIRAFVQPGGYAAMRLCGLSGDDAFIDATYLHFSGFADNRRSKWDAGLCETFGVDLAKLPRIVEPQCIVGHVTPRAARRCGLRAGVPVIAGCGDTAASFLACGATREGICVDVAGTASVFAATTGTYRADRKEGLLSCGRAATPGLWHAYAYINGGGMNVEWFLRQVANRGRTRGKRLWDLDRLNRLAEQIEPDETLPYFVPHMEGRVCPGDPHLRGSWANLSWGHTLGHLYRAVLEGVALEYGVYREALGRLYPGLALKEVRVTGGGAKSPLWNRMKASVLGTPVVQIAGGEGAADGVGAPMGAAMLAGFGVGLFRSLPGVARRWVARGERHRPQKRLAPYYRRRIKEYRALLDALSGFGRSTADARRRP